MKRGEIVGISRQLPADGPFRSYKDIKRYWKNSVSGTVMTKISIVWVTTFNDYKILENIQINKLYAIDNF